MPHMVVFRTNEGKPGYHLEETLDGAVRFVEHLRNIEQVSESKVYRMHEVPIEFKVMYKVEVAGSGVGAPDASEGAAGEGESPAAAPPQRTAAPSENRGEPLRATAGPGPTGQAPPAPIAQAGGRFGLFSRT